MKLALSFSLLLLGGCCAGGIDEMTMRVAVGPDITSRECDSEVLEWNGTTTVQEVDAVAVIANESGRGDPDDWIQIFDMTGDRVPVERTAVDEHECEHGCPTTRHFYSFPEPGQYTLVHFRSGGVTTDDEELSEYGGMPALVTELVVEQGEPSRG